MSSSDQISIATGGDNSESNLLGLGIGYSFFGKLFGRVTHAFTQIILARYLGPFEYGIFTIGWTLFRMVSTIAPLGLDQGVIKFASQISNPKSLPGFYRQAAKLALISGFLIGILFFYLSPWISNQIFLSTELTQIIRLFAVVYPVVSILKVISSSTLNLKTVKYVILVDEFIQPLSNFLLVIIFLTLGFRLNGMVAVSGFSFVIALMFSLIFFKKLFPERSNEPSGMTFAQLISFSLPSSFGIIFSILITLNDRILLGIFRPENEVGIYQAVGLFSLIFITLLSSVKTIFAPLISHLLSAGEREKSIQLFRTSTKWTLYLCVPFFLVFLLYSQELVTVIFGSEYLSGAPVLVLLVLGQIANMVTGPVDHFLIMAGYQKDWFVTSLIGFIFNICANLILIPMAGLFGAAISLSVTMFFLYLAGIIRATRLFRFLPYDRRFIKIAVAAATSFLICFLPKLTGNTSILFLIITAVIAASSFYTILYFMKFDPEDKDIFIYLFKKISVKLHFGKTS